MQKWSSSLPYEPKKKKHDNKLGDGHFFMTIGTINISTNKIRRTRSRKEKDQN